MSDDRFVSRKGRESEVFPKSTGQNAVDEGQVPLPFRWEKSSDKKSVLISLKEGFTFKDITADNLYVSNKGALPIGAPYIQFPGFPEPSEIYTGTWENVSALFPGDFFRVEGGDALAFGDGQQLDQMQRMQGRFGAPRATSATFEGAFYSISISNATIDTGPYARSDVGFDTGRDSNARTSDTTDGETRPVNQTIRIWERIS